jgi:hypothetical protein
MQDVSSEKKYEFFLNIAWVKPLALAAISLRSGRNTDAASLGKRKRRTKFVFY